MGAVLLSFQQRALQGSSKLCRAVEEWGEPHGEVEEPQASKSTLGRGASGSVTERQRPCTRGQARPSLGILTTHHFLRAGPLVCIYLCVPGKNDYSGNATRSFKKQFQASWGKKTSLFFNLTNSVVSLSTIYFVIF